MSSRHAWLTAFRKFIAFPHENFFFIAGGNKNENEEIVDFVL